MNHIHTSHCHAFSKYSEDSSGNLKWREMLEEVGAGTRSDPKIPRVFKAFSGNLTKDEIQIFNMMLVDWQLGLKKEKVKDGECPWYQPSSQRKDYFTFWGRLKRAYGFQCSDKDFKDFDGSVWNVMSDEMEKRYEEWVST